MKTYHCFIKYVFLLVLLGVFSCSPSKLAKDTMGEIRKGGDFITEKSKKVYVSGKDFLGMKEQDTSEMTAKPMTVSKRVFGQMADGTKVHEFRMINENGMEVSIIEYGAAIRELIIPDREGLKENVSLGFSSLDQYVKESPYFGCIAGRYANRIADGKFSIDGDEYQLATNNGTNHLHGGDLGFDKRVWEGKPLEDGFGVTFTYRSVDGEEGYPGNLSTSVTYSLSEKDELSVVIRAVTDQPTVVNLTNHAYFNLAGEGESTILDHVLTLPGTSYVATDETNIPTSIQSVVGTPFDFRTPSIIGARIEQGHTQLKFGKGYDHTWLVPLSDQELRHAATLHDPKSGRTLKLSTNQPGVQFYSGNYLDGSLLGNSGNPYPLRSGLCLEPQLFPDSPNQHHKEGWQNCILRPGETYLHHSVYEFFVK
jgi:aldose 1-epimerase